MLTNVMDNDLGYIAIDLSNASRQMLFDIVSQEIPKKDYYQSLDPDYAYINGNVSQKAHLTICYGIKNLDIEKRFKAAKLKLNFKRNIKIKNIQINLGYRGEYYIIVAIPEIDKDTFSFNSWIRQNNEIITDAPDFDPHLALCYIKNQGNEDVGEILRYFQENLIDKTVKFDSVNLYTPTSQEKITLIRF